MKERAALRKLEDWTIIPLLSVKNEDFFNHTKSILEMNGAKVLFVNEEIK